MQACRVGSKLRRGEQRKRLQGGLDVEEKENAGGLIIFLGDSTCKEFASEHQSMLEEADLSRQQGKFLLFSFQRNIIRAKFVRQKLHSVHPGDRQIVVLIEGTWRFQLVLKFKETATYPVNLSWTH
ncbi:hypothetical protein ACET3Z_001782 [Daucus carota]